MTQPTTYHRPRNLEEAIRHAKEPGALAMSGGALMFGALDLPYDSHVDLQSVPEFNFIDYVESANMVQVGSAVMLSDLLEQPYLPPALKQTLTRTLPPNLRNNISVAESLFAPNAPREWLTALVALGAMVEYFIPHEIRMVTQELADLVGSFTPASGLIATLIIPLPVAPAGLLGTAFVARTPADRPIVNAAAYVQMSGDLIDSALVVICGASAALLVQAQLDSLAGNPLDAANIERVAQRVAESVSPIGDYLGGEDYRRTMARVTAQRALLDCLAQR